MRKLTRRALVALLVLVGTFIAFGGTVSANKLSFNGRFFLIRWENGTFKLREAGTESTAECRVTLEGVLHSNTIPKVASVLIGYIDGATMNPCSTNIAGFLTNTLPWHVHYEGFTGTLPNIDLLKIEITDASIWYGPRRCLAVASAANPLKMTIGRGAEEKLVAAQLVETAIPFGVECLGRRLVPVATGTGEMFRFNTTERIRIILIN